ncbi:GNAT family N-acetyltransferase, partial [Turicibacter sanguinis]|nr:GNAT family N-acetyltransferase [Turicibacter sanguinis]
MKLMTHALTEDQAKVIASWRYEGKYALYNLP